MHMNHPSGPWPGATPEQIMQVLGPVTTEAMSAIHRGTSASRVLNESVLASYFVGRGVAPTAALELARQWLQFGAEEPARELETPVRPSERSELVRAIEMNMRDQATAAAFYRELINRIREPDVAEYVRHAMEDERKHYRLLGELHRELTGRTYEARPERVDFPDLVAGLKLAMDKEYEAFEEYRTIYLHNRSERVRNVFFELMTDELEHATRFNYALQRLQR